MPNTIHRARFALTHPDRILEDAAIHVSENGRIIQSDAWHGLRTDAGTEIIDWGDAVILPGLVNAHTHLELTTLHGQLTEFISFTDWALRLIRMRRTWTEEDYRTSARQGAQQALDSGTTLVGDISSSGFGWNLLQGEPLRRVVFEETLGLAPELAESSIARLRDLFDHAETIDRRARVHGVSPHAPYSTSGELYRQSVKFARSCRAPWTTHAAETLEELRFLETGTGEFREFLTCLGALPEGWKPPSASPVAWLDSLGILGTDCLLAHCNYLDDDSIGRIARSRCRVVYCPRSHAFFGHENHPIRRLLDAGIPVALGTDSLASNDSLSILDEMRELYVRRKDVAPEEILRAATVSGADALGFGGALGCLAPGYLADMAILELPGNIKSSRLIEQILEGAGTWRATIVSHTCPKQG